MSRRASLALAIGALACAVVSGATPADAAPKKKAKKPAAAAPAPPPPPKEAAPPAPAFDREAAALAIGSVDLQKCRATNVEKGEGHVMITFTPAGAATTATIDKGPWVGTPVAKCFAGQFKKAKIPAFSGDAVTVGKSFRIE